MQFHKCAICGKILAMVKEGVPDTIYEYCNLHDRWKLDMNQKCDRKPLVECPQTYDVVIRLYTFIKKWYNIED